MPGRLLLLITSPRVAPGLLSWPAWRALRESEVLTADADHPQLPPLAQAGVSPRVVAEESDPARARVLLDEAASGRDVVWLAAPDGDTRLMQVLRDAVAGTVPAGRAAGDTAVTGARGAPPEVEVLHASYDLPGARLLDLVATMDRLRRECPWDRGQTHASLAPYLLEEAYETVETIETGKLGDLPGELGDVLLQVAFHARVADERDGETGFGIDDVADAIVDKLVRRHPHVFGQVRVSGADEVSTNWAAIKEAEQRSVVDGVPLGQPALALAQALQRRASRMSMGGDEVRAFGSGLGAELFALVARAQEQGEDAEALLRHTARAFREHLLRQEGTRGRGG